eukprot:605680-Pelagomonas_calceolata.AAC.1
MLTWLNEYKTTVSCSRCGARTVEPMVRDFVSHLPRKSRRLRECPVCKDEYLKQQQVEGMAEEVEEEEQEEGMAEGGGEDQPPEGMAEEVRRKSKRRGCPGKEARIGLEWIWMRRWRK